MIYTISQASKILNISRVTMYKNISRVKGIKSYVYKQNNTTYIDDEGIELIRSSTLYTHSCKRFTPIEGIEQELEEIEEEVKPTNIDSSNVVNECKGINNQDELIKLLHTQIEDLKRDKEKLYTLIDNERQLHYNTQTLLKESQQRLLSEVQEVHSKVSVKGFTWWKWWKK